MVTAVKEPESEFCLRLVGATKRPEEEAGLKVVIVPPKQITESSGPVYIFSSDNTGHSCPPDLRLIYAQVVVKNEEEAAAIEPKLWEFIETHLKIVQEGAETEPFLLLRSSYVQRKGKVLENPNAKIHICDEDDFELTFDDKFAEAVQFLTKEGVAADKLFPYPKDGEFGDNEDRFDINDVVNELEKLKATGNQSSEQ
eukprot:TRINITY_DN5453_c0_g1_i1.p1 TRINITY_DN5453_c0_g1~~TRINITY_DN5453_c0_g1_i1.p1  ORF type:complete len:198 (-),score=57.69 TRINITY_DN5453_c0_g1_i1:79-672(-)